MNGRTLMLPIRVRTITTNNVKINVPFVNGGTTSTAQEAMNKAIASTNQALLKEQGFPNEHIQHMDGTFKIKNNQRGVLSLSLLNYSFAGGAHGNTLQKSLTFFASTGHSYTLSELFKPNSNYEQRLPPFF